MTVYHQDALFEFLKQSTINGMLNPATARSRKKAAQLLLVEASDAEREDLRCLDVDDLCSRVHKLEGSSIRPETLTIYGSRLAAALTDFLRWQDDPDSFRATPGDTREIRRRNEPAKPLPQDGVADAREQLILDPPRDPEEIFPIPLRPGCVAYVQNLPLDMTAAEADKICRVVRALAQSPHTTEDDQNG